MANGYSLLSAANDSSEENHNALAALTGWRAHARDALQAVAPLLRAAAMLTQDGDCADPHILFSEATNSARKALDSLTDQATTCQQVTECAFLVWAMTRGANALLPSGKVAAGLVPGIIEALDAGTDRMDKAERAASAGSEP